MTECDMILAIFLDFWKPLKKYLKCNLQNIFCISDERARNARKCKFEQKSAFLTYIDKIEHPVDFLGFFMKRWSWKPNFILFCKFIWCKKKFQPFFDIFGTQNLKVYISFCVHEGLLRKWNANFSIFGPKNAEKRRDDFRPFLSQKGNRTIADLRHGEKYIISPSTLIIALIKG